MQTETCFDLRPWARAHEIRWRYEDSYRAEKVRAQRGDGRWYVELLCDRGYIYPWGDDDLLAYVCGTLAEHVRDRLLAAGAKPHQIGDGEAAVRFPSRLLPEAVRLLGGGIPKGKSLHPYS